ncbi:MAG TPA: hypothetical protein VI854_04990, partial [Acidimicrobiia bacterium]|nr:hypothetical protein [Acidimicrobiia bacterium]
MSDVGVAEVVPLNRNSVRELGAMSGEPVVVSFYLDVDGRRRPRWTDVDEAVGQLVRRARERAARLGVEQAVERDLEAIQARLEGGLDRSAVRGLALFSCAGRGFLREIRVRRSVRDQVTVGRSPRVAQLEEALEADVPFVVMLADGQRCRIFLVRLGEVQEVGGPYDERERAVDVDRELGGFDHYQEEALRHHLRRCALSLLHRVEQLPAPHVVLAGTETVTAGLERYLDPA